jgi:XRE family aerobic/anaerobic benzoate catabolism transcriptional regulator
MKRVMAQGDNRPMAASKEAMADLKAILTAREAFYAKANFTIDTSQQALNETFLMLLEVASNAMRRIS